MTALLIIPALFVFWMLLGVALAPVLSAQITRRQEACRER